MVPQVKSFAQDLKMTHTSKNFQRAIKRATDFTVAIFLLTLASPLFALVAIAIRVSLGSPIFFVQVRPGLNCLPFRILKFRTMSDSRDSNGNLLPDNERLGRLGRFIRSTSLDELPQLLNVVSGKMSLVGPRPLLMEYLPLYSDRQKRRHNVLPGITGYAQVNGRNATDWATRLDLDVWYVENWSLYLDIKILISTAGVVVTRRGVSQPGKATMEKFKGPANGG